MAELWSVMELILLRLLTLSKIGEVKKLDPKLDPLYVKSHQKKIHLKRLRNGRVMVCYGI